MILSTHGAVGGGVALALSGNPILGLACAFFSHFLLDAIPHWDYKLRSAMIDDSQPLENDMSVGGSGFYVDLFKIGCDACVGLALAIVLFVPYSLEHPYIAVFGAIFAILPDSLQFVYWKVRREPLTSLQRFHTWIHARTKITSPILGVIFQIGVVLAATILFRSTIL